MMKIEIHKARVRVVMRNKQEGSVLGGTVQATCLGFESYLDVESDEPPERVAALVRQAESGCYTMQALSNPVPFERMITLNGAPLAPET